jgi:uncharacterized protein (DUF58 family)
VNGFFRGIPSFRAPRRLRFQPAGWVLSVSAVVLGVAAIATGNNLLFLMLGGMLGLIALSGWLSEVTLRGIQVVRRVPHDVYAGASTFLAYEVENRKRRLPSFALEIGEGGDPARCFLASLPSDQTSTIRVERVWPRRGAYRLQRVTLSTSFPFGFFQKERDVELDGEVVVWPRIDRIVEEPRPAGDRTPRTGDVSTVASAIRGEYRSLRPYRPGDDPRDVHWRSTARTGEPIVREYAREQAQTLWLCVDLRRAPGARTEESDAAVPREEVAIEIAAALAARASARGQPVGLVTSDERVGRAARPEQLERVLDALARAKFRPDAVPPAPPAPRGECVLVTAVDGSVGAGWGEVYTPEGTS